MGEETTTKMTSAIFVCFAVFAAAEPEADAGILGVNTLGLGYSNLGLSNIASPIGYSNIGLSNIASPIGYSNIGLSAIAQPIATSYSSPIISSIAAPAIISRSSLWKREAEAEPEADADAGLLGYSNLGLSTIARPIAYSNIGLSAIAQPIASPVVSSIAAPALISRSSLWRRDAEAEPEADPALLGINNLGYSNIGLSTIASPIGYNNIGLSSISSPIVSRIFSPSIISRPLGLGRLGL